MDINLTRRLIHAALDGSLKDAQYVEDKRFHLLVPTMVGGFALKHPRDTWPDKEAYDLRADKLVGEFCGHFDRVYLGKGITEAIARECPGK
jgi:phosphoenolpyruvate carboxykinase (ATP)